MGQRESPYQNHTRLMTNYTKDLKAWLAGKWLTGTAALRDRHT
jgi:hypothetical protein